MFSIFKLKGNDYMLVQSIIDGLMLGGVYSAVAVGLSLSFGVMRVCNWAHGEVLMIAMYIANGVVTGLGIDPYLSLIITGPVMFLIGFGLQKSLVNRLIELDSAREPMSVMMLFIGLGVVLTNLALLIFSANIRVTNTIYTGKTFNIGEIIFSLPRFISFVIALIATGVLYVFLMKSETGRALRATSQNRVAARLMGINEKWIYSIAFGLSCGLVGVSASLTVPFFSTYPTLAGVFGFKSFVIVVLGGKGSVPGALLGGLIVGLIEKVGGFYFSDTYAQIALFVVFILILLFRPRGLLGKEAED